MRVLEHDPSAWRRLQSELEALGVVYGTSDAYVSLLSPASVCLSQREVRDLTDDVLAVRALYRTWSDLYVSALAGASPEWLAMCAEHGLTRTQVDIQRTTARARREPMLTRIDYVVLSNAYRQIAEVQWKSAGPGFFIGHERAFASVFPLGRGVSRIGDLMEGYLTSLARISPHSPTVVVNEARSEWLRAEAHVVAAARAAGIDYYPVARATLPAALRITDGDVSVVVPRSTYAITVLRGRGFTEVLDDSALLRLANAVDHGRLWIEAPLSFIYRQKWGLALPFHPMFASLFEPRLRDILIPTSLILGDGIELDAVAARLPEPHRERLRNVRRLRELSLLPESTRELLVLKCGAGAGEFHNRSRGVYRLGGSRANAKRILDTVWGRAIRDGEPWIAQPYIDATCSVPMAGLAKDGSVTRDRAHARFLVFAGVTADMTWQLHGAIANFAHHWKVSGGVGSSFVDVRVEHC